MIFSSQLRSLSGRGRFMAAAVVLLAGALPIHAQATKVLDSSALHPPAGANVAIVEFDDLECPACAHANPILKAAAEKYHIPWIRHDLLIPFHTWSRQAAIYSRWFDQKARGLGSDYRDAVFANQNSIYNPNVLEQFTQNFAKNHGIALPFNVDPEGKLAGEVEADNQLSRRTGIQHTPTVFIVMAHRNPSYIEVQNVDTDLYRTIDQAVEATRQATPAPKPTHRRKAH